MVAFLGKLRPSLDIEKLLKSLEVFLYHYRAS